VRLRDLDAHFIRREIRPCHVGAPGCSTVSPHTEHECHVKVDALVDADGLFFLCPKCYATNGGDVGTHAVICWFEDKVPDDVTPGPGRWKPVGTGLDDLTFVVSKQSNSVMLTGPGCAWHGFVKDGDAT
jgi:hypothetical protein